LTDGRTDSILMAIYHALHYM